MGERNDRDFPELKWRAPSPPRSGADWTAFVETVTDLNAQLLWVGSGHSPLISA
jgi:hypothetical protein